MLGSALKGVSGKGAAYVPGFGTPRHIGTLFLTKYLFPFEVASLLLMVAAVGAVVLARRRRGPGARRGARATCSACNVRRPAYTGTMAEAAGLRFAVEDIERDDERTHGGAAGVAAAERAKGGW